MSTSCAVTPGMSANTRISSSVSRMSTRGATVTARVSPSTGIGCAGPFALSNACSAMVYTSDALYRCWLRLDGDLAGLGRFALGQGQLEHPVLVPGVHLVGVHQHRQRHLPGEPADRPLLPHPHRPLHLRGGPLPLHGELVPLSDQHLDL